MKLPRGVSASRLIRALEALGYRLFGKKELTSGCGTKDLRRITVESIIALL